MKFTITAERNGQTVELEFPCKDSAISQRLASVGVGDSFDTNAVIKSINWSALDAFVGKRCNLDELNFLAKFSESFDCHEHNRFCAAITTRQVDSLRDAINIAFNLRNFTLIDRFDNLEAIGREHYLTINLAMAVDEGNRTDFAELGRSLLENGVGQITPYGILFENGLTKQLVYCGNSFPGYIYEDCQLVMDISYRGELETISLPCEELAIDKALHRMGAPSPDVCDCVGLMYGYSTREWVREICPDISTGDIYELNRLAWVCADFSAGDFDKLVAVCKLTGADDLTKATAIAERIDTYRFTPGVSTPEQLGRRTIENAGQYIDTDQYGTFFDYEAYGQYLISEQIGVFCEGGYIEVEDESQLTPFDMDGNVTMGEM